MRVQWLGQTACPSGQFWDGTKCAPLVGGLQICASGYDLISGQCVAKTTSTSATAPPNCFDIVDLFVQTLTGTQGLCRICVTATVDWTRICENVATSSSNPFVIHASGCGASGYTRVDLIRPITSDLVCTLCVKGADLYPGGDVLQYICDRIVSLLPTGSYRMSTIPTPQAPVPVPSPSATTTTPVPAGSITLRQNHVYRTRLLIGHDPSKSSCDQVADSLNAAIAQGEQSSGWPWVAERVTANPDDAFLNAQGSWPANRRGEPYRTANACLLYEQGQWSAPNRTFLPDDYVKLLGPNTQMVDLWDHTDDPSGTNPLIDRTGACTSGVMTFELSTGAFTCVPAAAQTPPQCGANEEFVVDECLCKAGFVRDANGNCVAQTTTPGATTPGATTPGATTPGATTPGATTTLPIPIPSTPMATCPPNAYADPASPTGCFCDAGYRSDGAGHCVPVPPVTTTTPTTPAKKPSSNTALYVGLGAVVLGALFLAGKAGSL